MAVAVGGRGVGLAGGRVAVAVAGRLVGVGGIGLSVGVDVATRVGVSVGGGAAVGDGSTSTVGVAVHVAVTDGLGVLVGVGVAVARGATRESSGHAQLVVVTVMATAMARAASRTLVRLMGVSLTGRWSSFDSAPAYPSRFLSLGRDRWPAGRLCYLLDTKVMLVNWPASLQFPMSTCSSSDRGTGSPWLPTMSRTKG